MARNNANSASKLIPTRRNGSDSSHTNGHSDSHGNGNVYTRTDLYSKTYAYTKV